MALRAVAFDYGMVLSGQPDPAAHAQLERITGLDSEALERCYWVDRHDYDRGELTGLGFWRKLAEDAGLNLNDNALDELNAWDARMWTTSEPEMVAWQQRLQQQGFLTAILSNMGDSVLESIERSFDWIAGFDVLIWSYHHGMAKPEPDIYHLLLERLGTAAEETLFLDDKLVNIEAARHIGIRALQFSSVEQLRRDLIASGLDDEISLP